MRDRERAPGCGEAVLRSSTEAGRTHAEGERRRKREQGMVKWKGYTSLISLPFFITSQESYSPLLESEPMKKRALSANEPA